MLQASPQKIDFQRLAADLTFQLGDLILLSAALAVAQERLGSVFPQFPLPRCSTFGLTSQARATSANEAPSSSRRTAASLNSLVKFLRD
jgi:hypothetical protein